MRIFQFIKWWWVENDYFNRTVAVMLSYTFFITLPGLSIFGPNVGGILLLGGIVGMMCFYALFGLITYVSYMWRSFNKEMPPEDIQIINKLKSGKRIQDAE